MRSTAEGESILLRAVLLVALFIATPGFAGEGKEIGIGVSRPEILTTEVISIDKPKRTLRAATADGRIFAAKVRKDAEMDLDNIAKGDMIRIKYYEITALYSGKPGTNPQDTTGIKTMAFDPEQNGTLLRLSEKQEDGLAEIIDINTKTRSVTLKLTDGRVKIVSVDETFSEFDKLKINETMHIRLTKLMTVSVYD